jgi:hypothetical protein
LLLLPGVEVLLVPAALLAPNMPAALLLPDAAAPASTTASAGRLSE